MKKRILSFIIILSLGSCVISTSLDSISNSSNSISKSLDSISSISKSLKSSLGSISDSSSKEDKKDEKSAYYREISLLTSERIQHGIADDNYLREITRISNKYGITDWKSDASVYRAAGKGLKQARADQKLVLSQFSNHAAGRYVLEGFLN